VKRVAGMAGLVSIDTNGDGEVDEAELKAFYKNADLVAPKLNPKTHRSDKFTKLAVPGGWEGTPIEFPTKIVGPSHPAYVPDNEEKCSVCFNPTSGGVKHHCGFPLRQ